MLKRACRQFPVVTLTGPRQSGKTTLLKHLLGGTCGYASLDAPDLRARAEEDPRGFLDANPPPVIFDEIQQSPQLLPYIKERVDSRRERRGQYILTGSQNLALLGRVTETLAGRTAVLKLLPLSFREFEGAPSAALPWQGGKRREGIWRSPSSMWSDLLRGCYPEIALNRRADPALWHAGYVQTYLERDVRSLRQVGDLARFQSFLRALASRSAQLLNLSDLARDIGVAVNTARSWLSVLQATYQVLVVQPYFANVGKRLAKSPKVYFADTGTLMYLVGLRDAAHAMASPMAGAILETAVVTETYKTLCHAGEEPSIYYWRTYAGAEVDLIVDTGVGLVPIEIKGSATPNRKLIKGIEIFRKDLGERASRGYLVHTGRSTLPLGPDAITVPFSDF